MSLRVLETALLVRNMRARMPFRYGIATLTSLPHLFVRVELEIDGRRQAGLASDGLAPKWFTKDPATTFADDVADMLAVIQQAAGIAAMQGAVPTLFDLWQRTDTAQREWAAARAYPPLLAGFGVSLIERAAIDAFCRARGTTFAAAARANAFGIRLGDLHPSLRTTDPGDFLPARPARTVVARHTVGIGDPLRDGDIPPAERIADGLPQSLEAAVRAYGLTHFKVKLAAQPERDLERLRQVAGLLESASVDYRLTVDGNELFGEVEQFREFWQRLRHDPPLRDLLPRVLFVEQPFPRHLALAAALRDWHDRPPLIIDESDSAMDSLPQALAAGYAGTSHKNCKGVIHGLANACLLELRRRQDPGGAYLLSGEDLANVGPIALLQDLAVMAGLGVEHVERNGHHYFRGLSMYPEAVQREVVAAHPDLYAWQPGGFASLTIKEGRLQLDSINTAPFGYGLPFEARDFTPLADWRIESLRDAAS